MFDDGKKININASNTYTSITEWLPIDYKQSKPLATSNKKQKKLRPRKMNNIFSYDANQKAFDSLNQKEFSTNTRNAP